MGSCFSTTKVSGGNNNTDHQNRRSSAASKPTSTIPSTATPKPHNNHPKTRDNHKNQHQKNSHQQHIKNSSKKASGVVPCGKRTDFGYDKDFDKRYTIGKLLGHGQFGYTYVAIDKSNGDRVAVKRIEKNKVINCRIC